VRQCGAENEGVHPINQHGTFCGKPRKPGYLHYKGFPPCQAIVVLAMPKKQLMAFLCSIVGTTSASADELYFLTPPASAQKISCWASHFPKYDTIIGYSVLGHFFLRASADNEYIVLHPFKKAAKSYGEFASAMAFESKVLKDDGFAAYVLRPSHVAEIKKTVGSLSEGEVYIPEPYPFLGGSDRPETYSKGNVWVFMNIVGQFHGLCG
jgi:hypothetical protein